MLKIVIPMAGRGSRFADAGYREPKPMIPVNGVPMIKLVIDNLTPARPHKFVFVCQREHVGAYGLEGHLREWAPGSEIVQIDGVTEGAACTVLCASHFIDDAPLMIANSDQYVDVDIDAYLSKQDQDYDGLIMTMTSSDPKWSYVGMNTDQIVTTVVEKEVISNEATVGIYNFLHGEDYLSGARRMIAADKRVNGEFYVAPVYNELISAGAQIGVYNVGGEAAGMYGLGIPQDLELFLSLPIANRIGR